MADPMADLLVRLTDEALADALRDLGRAIAVPRSTAGADDDVAARARARIVADPSLAARSAARSRWSWLGAGRPARLAVGLALLAAVLLAAVAAAGILGVPGIRIALFGAPATVEPGPTASPGTPDRPIGAGAGLGRIVALADVAELTGFEPRLPAGFAPPDVAWLAAARLTLVWAAGPDLPETALDGVGLLVTEFRGRVDAEYYQKVATTGTVVEPVRVAGHAGYWLAGRPHFFFYVDPDGHVVDDTRRWVGDTLIVEADGITYRIESALGRDATVALAEGLTRP
ncbi:MAG TPA: hypothetical protein VFR14_01280 [Candidatus Limnocylindrales bacterium]|nr:hypothetical protein [Candidatus Limnocylindrales bacterium]